MGVEKMFAPIMVTLSQGHQATEAGQNLTCPHNKVKNVHPIATKLSRHIPLAMFFTWLNFEEFCQELFSDFFRKISNPFSQIEHSICHMLGMVGPIDVKQKGNDSTESYVD